MDAGFYLKSPKLGSVSKKGKTLILCVDRDNDVGVKAGVKTPIIGREENLKAAMKLALADPEEADANAIFGAIKLYDAERKNFDVEIATIAGSEVGGVVADRKLSSELSEVLEKTGASEVILVTDGYKDEEIIPIIQSRIPIVSIRRIVVRHSESIEETYAVLSRYLKEPKWSKVILGIPGLIILVLIGMAALNMLSYAGMAIAAIIGGYLVVKGFAVDKKMSELYRSMREITLQYPFGYVRLFVSLAGLIICLIGIYMGWMNVAGIPAEEVLDIPYLVGRFLEGSVILVAGGVVFALLGRTICHILERNPRYWINVVGIVATISIAWVLWETQKILQARTPTYPPWNLMIASISGVLLILGASLFAFVVSGRERVG